MPLLDCAVGVDVTNHTKAFQQELQHAARFRSQPIVSVVANVGAIVWGCRFAATHELTALEFFGVAASVGLYSGIVGVNTGHELCHKASALERGLGRLLLCSVSYGHFYVEHTLGHHKWVGTEGDPATARYGETLYGFIPRVVYGEFASAWEIDAARRRKYGLSMAHNEILQGLAVTACIGSAAGLAWGATASYFFAVQSVVAIVLFEAVNFLEHYGLERHRHADGSHDPVLEQHSWDSPARLTNMLLLKLQRHADHHMHAGKRFQTLQALEGAPQLPSGYATMVLLSFFPPLWRAVVHPPLLAHRAKFPEQVWRYGPAGPYGAVGV